MRRTISLILFITSISASNTQAQQLVKYCEYCPAGSNAYYFDSRDAEYAEWWINYHKQEVHGITPPTGWRSEQQISRPYLPGYLFLGGIAGATLTWALTDKGSSTQQEVLKGMAEGAFYGAVFLGLLWIVSAK